jgi:hypothetical protein
VKHLSRLVLCVAGLAASLPALASVVNPVSEPGIVELLAAGGIAGLVVWVRNRRK